MKNLTVDKMEEKDFIQMEPALKNINKRLSLEDDKKQYIDSLNEIKAEFLQALRAEDPILNFYKKTLLTDEKINIKGAYEFDVNVCIKLPFDCSELNLENGPSRGVVTIQIPGQLGKLKKSPQWEKFKSIDLWIDKDDYLLQIKLREWMRNVSEKAIDALKKSSNVIWSKYEVEMNSSGRRITLFVAHRQSNIKFSVNFFPALVFKESIWPSRVPKKYASEFSIDEWHAVPGQDSSCVPALSGKLWWISFPQQECNMLKGKQQLKITQQLIELLRENREFTFIKSYAIKSVFMLMVEKKKGDSSFWQKNLGYLFMVMLTDLHDRVSEGRIPFFWDRDYNMLSSTKPNQLNGCKQSLQGSIKFIVKNYTDYHKILTHLMPAGICISNENGLNIKLNDEGGIKINRDNCKISSKKHGVKPNEERDINLSRNNGVKSNEEHDIKLYDKNDVKLNEKSNVKTNKESDMTLNEDFIGKKNEESDINQNEDHNVNLTIEEHDKKLNEDHVEKPNKENDVKLIEEHDKKPNENHVEKLNKENDVRSIEEQDKKLNGDHVEKPNKENDVKLIEEHDKKPNENHVEKPNKENDVRSIEEQDKKLNGDHVEKPNKENDVKRIEKHDKKPNVNHIEKPNKENDARSIEEHDKKLNEDHVEKPNKENYVKLNEETKLHIEHYLESNKKNNSRPNEKHIEKSNDEHFVQPNVKLADTKRNNCILS